MFYTSILLSNQLSRFQQRTDHPLAVVLVGGYRLVSFGSKFFWLVKSNVFWK